MTANMNNDMNVMGRRLVMAYSVYMYQELDIPITKCRYPFFYSSRYSANLSNSVTFIVQVQLHPCSDECDLIFT